MDIEAKKSLIDAVNSFRMQYVTNHKMRKLVDAYRETFISLLNSIDLKSSDAGSDLADLHKRMKMIVENIQVISERVADNRRLFCRGEAVHIIPYEDSMRKSYEWKHVNVKDENGTIISSEPQLKLWVPHEFNTPWGSVSRRTIRDNNGKIMSFPAGKIGFIALDYSQKTLQTTTNILVTFDGYAGYTDYRNLDVHDYSLDPAPKDE